MVIVRRAKPEDQGEIERLLREASLDDDGVDKHLEHFFVVEIPPADDETAQMVGAAGMEIYESCALLRSLVVARASWNGEVSWKLMQILLSYAEHLDLEEVYLFANGASPWLQEIGFESVSFDQLPDEIQELPHVDQLKDKGSPLVFRRESCLYH
ncbi:GNAT family N-acetyltransferase [Thermoactinomyces sp. DSM 45892]|uniref:GNAT family N-acetyltransferase n=1 Tax=Thermoactinomyces sp. DSM 45892 TaxID=1882753 RepID=UPI00089CAF56|nr:hypothetical protein [Thermoactinomyces sp. DSM 45892]SDY41110.1 N-acetylglutamate synthase, GNAT family [Thermoactinomyces sp. DSM 45892]